MESSSFVPTQVSALVSSLCWKLLLYLCMYKCVCVVYVCVHVCARVFMWACVWACVQVRGANVETVGQHGMSSAICPPRFVRQSLSLNLGPSPYQLAGQPALETHLSLLAQGRGNRQALPHWALHVGTRGWTQVFVLAQASISLSHVPVTYLCKKKKMSSNFIFQSSPVFT